MTGCTGKMWLSLSSLILCCLCFSSSWGFDLRKLELMDNDNDHNNFGRDDSKESDEYDLELDEKFGGLNIEAVIGIAIGIIVVLFATPILLCFLCACWCFSYRKSKSTVVQVVAAPTPNGPQYMPQQHNNAADVHNQIATTQTYGSTSEANQNSFKDSIGLRVYPGSGDNLHETQSTNQYSNGVPNPGPSSTTDNQSHIYEQPPSYYAAVQSTEQYQPTNNEATKSTTSNN